MKKYSMLLVLGLFFVLWGASSSHALSVTRPNDAHIDASRRFGLGYDIDLNGITFRIGQINGLRFDISLGFGIEANTNGGPARFDLTPGFRLLFPIVVYKALVVQGVFGTQTAFNVAGSNTTINLSFFGGVMPEIFILPRLSIEILFGLAFNINNITDTNNSGAQISFGTVGKGISIISGAAFHWYF